MNNAPLNSHPRRPRRVTPLPLLLSACGLALAPLGAPAAGITFEDFALSGELASGSIRFALSGRAEVDTPAGGELAVVSGPVALAELPKAEGFTVRARGGAYLLAFEEPGSYPVSLTFNVRVTQENGWENVSFGLVTSPLGPVELKGIPEDAKLEIAGASEPVHEGLRFSAVLSPRRPVAIRWKAIAPEVSGKLFYSAEASSVLSVAPGLLRQSNLYDFRVMQGELDRLDFAVAGAGEVTRVEGKNLLSWGLVADPEGGGRRLEVRLNEPQSEAYQLVVHSQTPLAAFPLQVEAMRIVPDGAIRFGGHLLAVNSGAVRLEVVEANGLSQISPERFPRNKSLQGVTGGTQAFAYRFSSADYTVRVQADNILPELTVSALLAYHLGETDASVVAEFDIDIREAPLREFSVLFPAGYAVPGVEINQLSDYATTPAADGRQRLQLTFGQPLSGRQILRLRLERNAPVTGGSWELPKLEPEQVKTLRGNIGVSADPGIRLSTASSAGLSETATAFFPKRIEGLQVSYRLKEATWEATLKVERLDPSVGIEAVHIYSLGEGIVYGSSLLTYQISGAPVQALRVRVPEGGSNLEFVGREIANWRRTEAGDYLISLHSPASGAYDLLATYDRKFKPAGDELSFNGVEPVGVQSDQGFIILVSDYQYSVATTAAEGLLGLETEEIPADYRLLFDSPILASYQYAARAFDLRHKLSLFGHGATVGQVVEHATVDVRVSGKGEVLTAITYLVKNQGKPHFRLGVPGGVKLWSAEVNGKRVTPVVDRARGGQKLVPLPPEVMPNEQIKIELKLASKAAAGETVIDLPAPVVDVPVVLANWTITPEEGFALVYSGQALAPSGGAAPRGGFRVLLDLLASPAGNRLVGGLVCALFGLVLFRGALRWGSALWRWVFALGGLAAVAAGYVLITVIFLRALEQPPQLDSTPLSFSAPVQVPGQPYGVTVENIDLEAGPDLLPGLLPALLGAAGFLFCAFGPARVPGRWTAYLLYLRAFAWLLVFWGALFLHPGAAWFAGALLAFLVVQTLRLLLALRHRLHLSLGAIVPRGRKGEAEGGGAAAGAGAAGSAGALLAFALLTGTPSPAEANTAAPPEMVDAISVDLSVAGDVADVRSKLTWEAEIGQRIIFLRSPAVLTEIETSSPSLEFSHAVSGDGKQTAYLLEAARSGRYTATFGYQVKVDKQKTHTDLALPQVSGLVNRAKVSIDRPDLILEWGSAVSIVPDAAAPAGSTAAEVLLAPGGLQLRWRPRSRDRATEAAVYYAELHHLYRPSAGVVEGFHEAQVRLAQGEVRELIFAVPEALTITDVIAAGMSDWRFDPDQRQLRVNYENPITGQFALRLKSQRSARPLPYRESVGVISLQGSAGQPVGMIAVGVGSQVNLGDVQSGTLSIINLDDFNPGLVAWVREAGDEVVVKRAFRYADADAELTLDAVAVEPHVEVTTQETLSLAEDRTVLASNLTVQVKRAGIFKLSFVLPAGLEVETISGEQLSHWTEQRTADGRVITLNLKGKTLGSTTLYINLAGAGVGDQTPWPAPRLVLREASKQRGILVVVPEQGLSVDTSSKKSVSDRIKPQELGIKNRNALVFRLLEADWQLSFNLKKLDPWIQVAVLQDVNVREASVEVAVTANYKIEHAGLKALRLRLPALASGVRFSGANVSDTVAAEDGSGDWEVKLHRRVIGAYPLQVYYQLRRADNTLPEEITGVHALDADIQSGFLSLRAKGRLQVSTGALPDALTPSEWQSVPAALRRGAPEGANAAFRVVDPDFALPIRVVRHEAASVLPARVEAVALTSVLSEEGKLLTSVKVTLQPGDKRHLRLTMPPGASFWFAFVNLQSATPWADRGQLLIPLEPASLEGQPTTVEFFYATNAGDPRSFRKQLAGPQFDLPLENITWRVFIPPTVELDADATTGTLALRRDAGGVAVSQSQEMTIEANLRQIASEADQYFILLEKGNSYYKEGKQEQARKALNSAFNLSQNDLNFNEDARVQLNNLRTAQAVVGLANRSNKLSAGVADAASAGENVLDDDQLLNFTQEQAQKVLGQVSAEQQQLFKKLAQHLIDQQQAAVVNPQSIRTMVPEEGVLVEFSRRLQVDRDAAMRVDLHLRGARAASFSGPLGGLAGALGVFVVLIMFLTVSGLRKGAAPAPAAPTPPADPPSPPRPKAKTTKPAPAAPAAKAPAPKAKKAVARKRAAKKSPPK